MSPYAKQLLLAGQGNHETSALRHNETNLTKRLVNRLRAEAGGNVLVGCYADWIRLMLNCNHIRQSVNLYYTHGSVDQVLSPRDPSKQTEDLCHIPMLILYCLAIRTMHMSFPWIEKE